MQASLAIIAAGLFALAGAPAGPSAPAAVAEEPENIKRGRILWLKHRIAFYEAIDRSLRELEAAMHTGSCSTATRVNVELEHENVISLLSGSETIPQVRSYASVLKQSFVLLQSRCGKPDELQGRLRAQMIAAAAEALFSYPCDNPPRTVSDRALFKRASDVLALVYRYGEVPALETWATNEVSRCGKTHAEGGEIPAFVSMQQAGPVIQGDGFLAAPPRNYLTHRLTEWRLDLLERLRRDAQNVQ